MKKLKLSFIISFLASIFIVFTVFADQLSDFQYTYETYLSSYQTFAVSRSAYLKHQTVATENELIEKTNEILHHRAKVYITYFYALQANLRTKSKIKTEDKNYLNDQLNSQIALAQVFLNNLKESEKTIEKLKIQSAEFEKFDVDFQKIAYLTNTQISLDKLYFHNQQIKDYNQKLEKILNEIDIPTKDEPILKNWLADSNRFSKEIDDNILTILDEWQKFRDYQRATVRGNENYYNFFENKINLIDEKLKKANFYQKQILNQI